MIAQRRLATNWGEAWKTRKHNIRPKKEIEMFNIWFYLTAAMS